MTVNTLDWLVAQISPKWAAERLQWRARLQAYDAATLGRTRKTKRESKSGNSAARFAVKSLREQARWLDQSYDLVTAVLDVYVNSVVGPHGIQIEPQPRKRDGSIHEEFAAAIITLLDDWAVKPEVTHVHDKAGMERLACLTWARDGEVFGQHVQGASAALDHGTRVPYSIEMIEPDMIPLDYENPEKRIIQGITVNDWGRPRVYHAYKRHPGDQYYLIDTDIKEITADRMIHLKLTRRIGQLRGVSRLATVLTRIEDLKDYEESERVAARVAAAMTAFIQKGTPDMYEPGSDEEDSDGNRLFNMAPGIIWDNLMPGEQVGTVQSNRPSNLLAPFRDAMVRAVAGGAGVSYSSASKNYNGTYSAQRQELVEQFVTYSANTAQFIAQWTRPTYRRMLQTAIAARLIRMPADLDPLSIEDAEYRGPVMPWIDPQKEAQASVIQVQAGFKSRAQVIRERGGNPQAVHNEILREREQDAADDLIFSTDWKTQAAGAILAAQARGESREEDAA